MSKIVLERMVDYCSSNKSTTKSKRNTMKRQEHKSAKGCCICRCKSSTSRFAKSDIWEKFFGKCFLLREGERKGDMCNACVLVVKRFSREAKESSYEWVVDSRRGPGSKNMMKIKKLRKMQRENERENENPLEKLLAELPVKKKAPRKQSKNQIRKRDSLPQTSLLIGDDDNSTLRSQEELDEMWNKSFRRELPVPSKYGEDLTGYEMCCGLMLYSSKSQTAFCLKKSYKICPMHLQLSKEKLLHSKNSSTVTSTYSEVSEDSCDALSRGSPETLSLMDAESLSNMC